MIFVEVVHAGLMAVQKNAKKRSCRQEKNERGQRSPKKHTGVGSVVVEQGKNPQIQSRLHRGEIFVQASASGLVGLLAQKSTDDLGIAAASSSGFSRALVLQRILPCFGFAPAR